MDVQFFTQMLQELTSELVRTHDCGVNLEYTPEFYRLEELAKGKADEQIGKVYIQAQAPLWSEVKDLALVLLKKSKDLRLLNYLAEATLALGSFRAFKEVLKFLVLLVTDYWDSLYPVLDAEDAHDPTLRLNLLQYLGSNEVLLFKLNKVLDELLNRYAAGGGSTAPLEAQELWQALSESGQALLKLEEVVSARLAASALAQSRSLDLRRLKDTLKAAEQRLSVYTQAESGLFPAAKGLSTSAALDTCMITSRAEVKKMLQALIVYYERFEPSSPLPLLLKQCQNLVEAPFLDILQKLAPEAVVQLPLKKGE